VPFSYSICAFFDSPQTASQFTLVALMGETVIDDDDDDGDDDDDDDVPFRMVMVILLLY
jgi:hypothetical protein